MKKIFFIILIFIFFINISSNDILANGINEIKNNLGINEINNKEGNYHGENQNIAIISGGFNRNSKFLKDKILYSKCFSGKTDVGAYSDENTTFISSCGNGLEKQEGLESLDCNKNVTSCSTSGDVIVEIISKTATKTKYVLYETFLYYETPKKIVKKTKIDNLSMPNGYLSNVNLIIEHDLKKISTGENIIKSLIDILDNYEKYNISVIFIPLSEGLYLKTCDSLLYEFGIPRILFRNIINELNEKGIIIVAPSGDFISKKKLSFPACDSFFTAIGATDEYSGTYKIGGLGIFLEGTQKGEKVKIDLSKVSFLAKRNTLSDYSNFGAKISFLTPGTYYELETISNNNNKHIGSKYSAAIFSASWAILKSIYPKGNKEFLYDILNETGLQITGGNENIYKPKINLGKVFNKLKSMDGFRYIDFGKNFNNEIIKTQEINFSWKLINSKKKYFNLYRNSNFLGKYKVENKEILNYNLTLEEGENTIRILAFNDLNSIDENPLSETITLNRDTMPPNLIKILPNNVNILKSNSTINFRLCFDDLHKIYIFNSKVKGYLNEELKFQRSVIFEDNSYDFSFMSPDIVNNTAIFVLNITLEDIFQRQHKYSYEYIINNETGITNFENENC